MKIISDANIYNKKEKNNAASFISFQHALDFDFWTLNDIFNISIEFQDFDVIWILLYYELLIYVIIKSESFL